MCSRICPCPNQDAHPLKDTHKRPYSYSESVYTPHTVTRNVSFPWPLASQRSNSKVSCFHWQESKMCLSQTWHPRVRLIHQLGAGSCTSLNTYTLIHTPIPSLTLLAPSLLHRTKKLIREVCGKEMGRLAGSSCCHHGYQLTHFSSTQTGPPSPGEAVTGSFG